MKVAAVTMERSGQKYSESELTEPGLTGYREKGQKGSRRVLRCLLWVSGGTDSDRIQREKEFGGGERKAV